MSISKEQVKKQINAMKNDIIELIDNATDKLLNVGVLNLEDYEEDTYEVSKLIMQAIGKEITEVYKQRSVSRSNDSDVNNLYLHI
jgi:hypothetical protein